MFCLLPPESVNSVEIRKNVVIIMWCFLVLQHKIIQMLQPLIHLWRHFPRRTSRQCKSKSVQISFLFFFFGEHTCHVVANVCGLKAAIRSVFVCLSPCPCVCHTSLLSLPILLLLAARLCDSWCPAITYHTAVPSRQECTQMANCHLQKKQAKTCGLVRSWFTKWSCDVKCVWYFWRWHYV